MAINLFDDDTLLPVTTRNGIPYEVDIFEYKETWAPNSNRTVIQARVRTEDAWVWVTDMVGRVYRGDNGSGSLILRRDLPERNPFDYQQFCTKVEQVDQGGPSGSVTIGYIPGVSYGDTLDTYMDPSNGWPLTKWIRYRCTFEAMPHQMREDAAVDSLDSTLGTRELGRYVIRSQKSYPKEQQIPGGGFRVVDDGTPANRVLLMTSAFKSLIYADVSYTWCRVPVVQFAQMAAKDDLLGKANSTVFDAGGADAGGYSWPVDSLLYVGYDDTNRYYDANEDWVVDVVYSFRFKEGGWNHYLNNLGALVEVSSDGTTSGTSPYSSGDFHDLFEVYAS